MSEALKSLVDSQSQNDEEGVTISVSRQALHEVIGEYESLRSALAASEAARKKAEEERDELRKEAAVIEREDTRLEAELAALKAGMTAVAIDDKTVHITTIDADKLAQMSKELAETQAALSDRTASCGNCHTLAEELEAYKRAGPGDEETMAAYRRANNCSVGGHDDHEQIAGEDRCTLARALRAAWKSLDEVKKERDNWMETAAQFWRGSDFYRGLVVKIGLLFGESAYISDDGSKQQDVLCLKIPELVSSLVRDNKSAEQVLEVAVGALEEIEKAEAPIDKHGDNSTEALRWRALERMRGLAQRALSLIQTSRAKKEGA